MLVAVLCPVSLFRLSSIFRFLICISRIHLLAFKKYDNCPCFGMESHTNSAKGSSSQVIDLYIKIIIIIQLAIKYLHVSMICTCMLHSYGEQARDLRSLA